MFTLLSYLFVYTPLKRKTSLCTLVGAVPGAIPPLIGWAAACGKLTVEAWTLFLVIFLWQFPHFMAIAWMYLDDYYRAVLPGAASRPRGRPFCDFADQTLLPLCALIHSSAACRLLTASIIYLPLLFILMIFRKG